MSKPLVHQPAVPGAPGRRLSGPAIATVEQGASPPQFPEYKLLTAGNGEVSRP